MKHLKKFESPEFGNILYRTRMADYNSIPTPEDNDLMSDEEVKEEVLDIIKNLKRTTNEWSTRETLKKFTDWGFWSGNSMSIINIETADDITRELYDYVDGFPPGHPNIKEVYDAL